MDHDKAIRDELRKAAERLGGDGKNMRRLSRAKLYDIFEDLGADRFLLAAVGSWGDTAADDEVLEQLRRWNRGEPPFDEVIATTGGKRG